jgi:hypothetical protein
MFLLIGLSALFFFSIFRDGGGVDPRVDPRVDPYVAHFALRPSAKKS